MGLAIILLRQEIIESPAFADFVIYLYIVCLSILFIFGMHGFIMVYYYHKYKNSEDQHPQLVNIPMVTVQLPLYNELYVAKRLIDAVCAMDYPKDKLEIQVLDDSVDETVELVRKAVEHYQALGFDIKHIRRENRAGYKAGALKYGLELAKGEFIAIFDADFVPRKDFLTRTIPYFYTDPKIAVVQTRWEHINREYSMLTRAQAFSLDGHFILEQDVRNKAGLFIQFNGTAGVWRKEAIIDAGNWHSDTLTEDLDLSYRAQLRGWKFKYLSNITSPAELPVEVNALKSQQFRWTKGAIETARKILPELWKSKLPLRIKIYSTFHLTNNIVFPFIFLAGLLNVPLIYIKHQGGHELYFAMMSVFILAFIGSFLFYLVSQKSAYPDWRRRILLFPLFMAGSMGFAINNTRAVIEGLLKKKSEFVRTPKFAVQQKQDNWIKNKYVAVRKKIDIVVICELLFALYCLFGVISSIYYLEIAAVPFQLLYFAGFASISMLSIKHALRAKKLQEQ